MRSTAVAAWLMIAALLAGCRNSPAPPADQPAAPPAGANPTLQQLRAAFAKDPKVAAVGVVQIVLSDDKVAQVGEVPAAEFKDGDIVTFVGPNGAVGAAHVIAVKSDCVHVSWSERPGQRAPAIGDLAVKFKQ